MPTNDDVDARDRGDRAGTFAEIRVRMEFYAKQLDEVRTTLAQMQTAQVDAEHKRDDARRQFWFQSIIGPIVVGLASIVASYTFTHH